MLSLELFFCPSILIHSSSSSPLLSSSLRCVLFFPLVSLLSLAAGPVPSLSIAAMLHSIHAAARRSILAQMQHASTTLMLVRHSSGVIAAAAGVRHFAAAACRATSCSSASACRCCATSNSSLPYAAAPIAALPSPFSSSSLSSFRGGWNSLTAGKRGVAASSAVRAFSTLESVGDAPPSSADPHARFVVVYTCMVCETRAAKSVSRQAYDYGVVLLRCDGCEKLHLFADRLGWFDDNSTDVESILAAKGVTVGRSSLDMAPQQLEQLQQLQKQMQAQADERRAKQAASSTDPAQAERMQPLLPEQTPVGEQTR